jgi:hypothetical protein
LNLLSEQRVSVEEKLRRQLVMEVFCTEKHVYYFETSAKSEKNVQKGGGRGCRPVLGIRNGLFLMQSVEDPFREYS